MNGRDLALVSLAGLAVASATSRPAPGTRRGSTAQDGVRDTGAGPTHVLPVQDLITALGGERWPWGLPLIWRDDVVPTLLSAKWHGAACPSHAWTVDDFEVDRTDDGLQTFHQALTRIATWSNALVFPLRVWRGLSLGLREVPFPDKGRSWTTRREIAEHFARGTHREANHRWALRNRLPQVLLSGIFVSPSDVNWYQTFKNAYHFDLDFDTTNPAIVENEITSLGQHESFGENGYYKHRVQDVTSVDLRS